MSYEINVSYKGQHYFATDSRSIADRKKLNELLTQFRAVFPEHIGYKVLAYYCEKRSTLLDL